MERIEIKKEYLPIKDKSRIIFITFVLLLVVNFEKIIEIIKFNYELLFFIIFVGIIAYFYLNTNKINKDVLLQTLGIVVAISTFVFSIVDSRNEKITQIKVSDDYNCVTAYNIKMVLGGKEDKEFTYTYYIVDVYKDNLGFIVSNPKYFDKSVEQYSQFIYDASYSNSLTTLIANNGNSEINKQIMGFTDKIINDFCNK